MREHEAHTESAMRALGARLGPLLRPGDVVTLEGGLGAGKTTLARGIAGALGVLGPVQSPTYVGVQHYATDLPLWHADLYRMDGPHEVEQLGLWDWMGREGVVVIEWPERMGAELPDERLEVRISEQGNVRVIRAVGHGPRGMALEMEW